ncbi:MAG: prepilin-type N-terminal cleavage/methylation domain-containing protein [Acidobacteriota bacterium]
MSNIRKRADRGFTLIELLIVVAVIGIIAAIAIPNLMQALQMARQKRSFGDLRTIVIALTTYSIDYNHFPILGDTHHMALVPYLGKLPALDGWDSLYGYQCGGDGSQYTAVCYGSNRTADPPYEFGRIYRHKDDIVYIDSQLVQWPEGTQSDE